MNENEKKNSISYILLKVKPYYFANIYHWPFSSHQDLNIEAPYLYVQSNRGYSCRAGAVEILYMRSTISISIIASKD